jgi:Na+-transporting methylmalonyl-CoA/oxaloacetate decarboxylase gamma subunit
MDLQTAFYSIAIIGMAIVLVLVLWLLAVIIVLHHKLSTIQQVVSTYGAPNRQRKE